MGLTYKAIVFTQGYDAATFFDILDESGEDTAFQYLCQWRNGDPNPDPQGRAEAARVYMPWSPEDTLYRKDNLIMVYNKKLVYASLQEEFGEDQKLLEGTIPSGFKENDLDTVIAALEKEVTVYWHDHGWYRSEGLPDEEVKKRFPLAWALRKTIQWKNDIFTEPRRIKKEQLANKFDNAIKASKG